MLLAGGLGQQGMGSAAGAVAGYGGRLCGQGAAEYAAGGARAAVINDRELRSECGEQESGYCKIRRVWLFVGWRSFIAGSRSVGVVVGSSSTHVRTAHARSEARRRVGPYRSWGPGTQPAAELPSAARSALGHSCVGRSLPARGPGSPSSSARLPPSSKMYFGSFKCSRTATARRWRSRPPAKP